MSEIETASTSIHLLAGQRPDGQLIYETVFAKDLGDSCYQLTTSPVFARGAAKNDIIRLMPAGRFEVEQHNGNLCVRVLAKKNIDIIRQRLEAPLAVLGAELDYQNDRTLVYSIPVKAGFDPVEVALNQAIQGAEAIWLYANVYDPMDNETPLNWWHDFLAQ
jgi:hypothetical protein